LDGAVPYMASLWSFSLFLRFSLFACFAVCNHWGLGFGLLGYAQLMCCQPNGCPEVEEPPGGGGGARHTITVLCASVLMVALVCQ
jgi:hypothetical protein